VTEKTIRLSVQKMKCNGCVKNIEFTLNELEQVSGVSVNLEQKSVEVKTSEAEDIVSTLIKALEEEGYEAQIAA